MVWVESRWASGDISLSLSPTSHRVTRTERSNFVRRCPCRGQGAEQWTEQRRQRRGTSAFYHSMIQPTEN